MKEITWSLYGKHAVTMKLIVGNVDVSCMKTCRDLAVGCISFLGKSISINPSLPQCQGGIIVISQGSKPGSDRTKGPPPRSFVTSATHSLGGQNGQ